jgi:hypothetical protein
MGVVHELPKARRKPHESTRTLYLASAGASFIAILLDLIQNTQTALGNKIGQRLSEIWPYSTLSDRAFATAGSVLLAIFFLVAVSLFLCWVRKPPSREEAFVRGLGVLSVLTLIAPYNQHRGLNEAVAAGSRPMVYEVRELAGPNVQHSGISTSMLATVQIVIRTPEVDPGFQALITLRDANTGAVLGTRVTGRQFSLSREPDTYVMEIEAEGYRRTRTMVTVGGLAQAYIVDIEASKVPVGLQLVYPPDTVIATPSSPGLITQ